MDLEVAHYWLEAVIENPITLDINCEDVAQAAKAILDRNERLETALFEIDTAERALRHIIGKNL